MRVIEDGEARQRCQAWAGSTSVASPGVAAAELQSLLGDL